MAPPTRPLRPIIPNNARTLCITAAAGTELAGASSSGTVIIVPLERAANTAYGGGEPSPLAKGLAQVNSLEDGSAAYQLVGEVTAHQGDDG